MQASPIQRTGQNFDLSADGLNFTVIRNGNLEVYRLAALTKKDEEQLKLAAADMPEKNDARIKLEPIRPKASGAEAAAAKPTNVFTLGMGDSESSADAALPNAPESAPVGDGASKTVDSGARPAAPAAAIEPDKPRSPPSLYGPDYPKPPGV